MERRHARSGSPYEETIGFSRAVRVGSTVAVSGTAPVWPDGHVDPDPAAQAGAERKRMSATAPIDGAALAETM